MKDTPSYKQKWSKLLVVLMSALLFLGACSDDADAMATDAETASSIDKEAQESTEKEAKRVAKEEKKAKKESEEQAEKEQKEKENEQKQAEKAAEKEREKAEKEAAKQAEAESKAKEEELTALQHEMHATAPSVDEGVPYIIVNDDIPLFTNEDITDTDEWDAYGELDDWGRVTQANAVLSVDLMPAEERGDIGDIHPTGWNQARYADIGSGGWLYNRSHLIGHQLTGNDSRENLITGTRFFNMAMLEFESFVADYVERTENHVRYRITPVFDGDNRLAAGIYMEGFSIEDNGEGVQFHVFVPNHQPGVLLSYADGSSQGPEGPAEEPDEGNLTLPPVTAPEVAPEQSVAPAGGDVSTVDTNGNGQVTIKEAKAAGFSMPIYSDHWLYPYMDDRDGDGMVGE